MLRFRPVHPSRRSWTSSALGVSLYLVMWPYSRMMLRLYSPLTLAADISAGGRPPAGWSRPRGRPCKSWLDQILFDLPIPIEDALACALDRERWRRDATALLRDR